MQECLEEGRRWHWSVFALFLFALLVQFMAFLHTGWTYTTTLHFGTARLHAVIDEISLSLFSDCAALRRAKMNFLLDVIACNSGIFAVPPTFSMLGSVVWHAHIGL